MIMAEKARRPVSSRLVRSRWQLEHSPDENTILHNMAGLNEEDVGGELD
jgi:hypothetical protein